MQVSFRSPLMHQNSLMLLHSFLLLVIRLQRMQYFCQTSGRSTWRRRSRRSRSEREHRLRKRPQFLAGRCLQVERKRLSLMQRKRLLLHHRGEKCPVPQHRSPGSFSPQPPALLIHRQYALRIEGMQPNLQMPWRKPESGFERDNSWNERSFRNRRPQSENNFRLQLGR